ncbi:MAG: hypothetical protein SV062_11125 [Thermodesulfobacteriota bacterium]|nr:hypothetical protein [Thermodesulfobacteriota bacterium]
MTKEELLKLVKEGIKTEESAVTIYMNHLSAIILRSGLPDEEILKIKKSITFLIEANKQHKKILESLVDRIQKESASVY